MTSLIGRAYRHRYAPLGAFVFIVLLNSVALGGLQQQADVLEAEQQARAEMTCDATIQGRANQLINNEILIRAAADGDENERQRRSIERFRALSEQVYLSELPATCEGIIRLDVFRGRVRETVDDALADLPSR